MTHSVLTQKNLGYQTPPSAIADLANAPQTPLVSVNNQGDWMLILERPGYPTIEELAQPELKLAGIRINPQVNGTSRTFYFTHLKIKRLQEKQEYPITGLPEGARIENVSWSPNGQSIAFTLTETEGIALWIAHLNDRQAQKITSAIINDAMPGLPYNWLSDSKTIIFKAINENRGKVPEKSLVPAGPVIQESTGKKSPARTYQDLLENTYDEALFEYYCTSQLVSVNLATQEQQQFGVAGIIDEVSPSPDGNYILVTTIHQPYSYFVPYQRFPMRAEIWNRKGRLIQTVADLPLADTISVSFGAVREGPREFSWRADQPATLYWVEAQDGGDPNRAAETRDQLFYIQAPFEGKKQESIRFSLRLSGVLWGHADLAITYEWWWNNRKLITSAFHPEKGDKKILFDRSFEDRYNNPGTFETQANVFGRRVLLTDKNHQMLYLKGDGASPEGNRPFVDELNLSTLETKRLWQSEAPYYESPIQVLDIEKQHILTRRESKAEPPNYYVRDLSANELIPLTSFPHPYPELKGVEKQVVRYQRKDGVALQGNLYVPRGFKEGDPPLPALLWAYPNEFKSADAASQVAGSPYEFIRIGWPSPLFWVTRGYAVLDNPSMPIVAADDREPNDTFTEQLVSNAAAAIDKLAELGVADRNRIAVGGHSYGAFMTANLLAHSDLFAAGIARSGAYNRTLTPFGFQAEERTLWEAPEVYQAMSPFMHADKIKVPILFIHGEADNNAGTFPLQSQRFYQAIKGLGGITRLVMLPHESHGYQAKESILHMLWEMDQWLEKYVKHKEGITDVHSEKG